MVCEELVIFKQRDDCHLDPLATGEKQTKRVMEDGKWQPKI